MYETTFWRSQLLYDLIVYPYNDTFDTNKTKRQMATRFYVIEYIIEMKALSSRILHILFETSFNKA